MRYTVCRLCLQSVLWISLHRKGLCIFFLLVNAYMDDCKLIYSLLHNFLKVLNMLAKTMYCTSTCFSIIASWPTSNTLET